MSALKGRDSLWMKSAHEAARRVIHRFAVAAIPAVPSLGQVQAPERNAQIKLSRFRGVSY
jgi:hypothetical protein